MKMPLRPASKHLLTLPRRMAQRPIRYMTINLRQDRATQLHSVIIETAPKSPFLCVKNQCLSVELGCWIPIVRGIPDSLRCIPHSKAQDSSFHRQKFPGFRNQGSLSQGEKHITIYRGKKEKQNNRYTPW